MQVFNHVVIVSVFPARKIIGELCGGDAVVGFIQSGIAKATGAQRDILFVGELLDDLKINFGSIRIFKANDHRTA